MAISSPIKAKGATASTPSNGPPNSRGAGHDVLNATQFLLLPRCVRRLVARMDLDEYRSRSSPPQEYCRPTHQRRGCGLLEARASAHGDVSAIARLAGSER